MIPNSKIIFVGGLIIGLAAGYVGSLFFAPRPAPVALQNSVVSPPSQAVDCTVKNSAQTVTGNSLGNLLKAGSQVKLLQNYYACNPVARDDIAEYNYPGSSVPIAKVVKGVPGDTFALVQVGSGKWNIVVNGSVAKTSEGKPYVIDDHAYRLLSLYVNDYHGVIPADAYLILGDLPGGTVDSTQFGLVGRSDFAGKIQK